MTRFVFDSIGSQLSTKKIADTLSSAGRRIDVKIVERFLDGLMESFVIYQAKRFNIKRKQYLKAFEKQYNCFSKSQKKTAKSRRRIIKKQIGYLGRDLRIIAQIAESHSNTQDCLTKWL